MTFSGSLPAGSSILHSAACPNKGVNLLTRTVLPGSTFPDVRLELGCTIMCFVHLGSKTGPDTPILAPAPHPLGFTSALAHVFGDESVRTIDAQAIAELAAAASTYQPTPKPTTPVTQVPDSQTAEGAPMEMEPTDPGSSQVLIPYIPESSAPELPMDLGNGQNTERSGLGDSQHAHSTPLRSEEHTSELQSP